MSIKLDFRRSAARSGSPRAHAAAYDLPPVVASTPRVILRSDLPLKPKRIAELLRQSNEALDFDIARQGLDPALGSKPVTLVIASQAGFSRILGPDSANAEAMNTDPDTIFV